MRISVESIGNIIRSRIAPHHREEIPKERTLETIKKEFNNVEVDKTLTRGLGFAPIGVAIGEIIIGGATRLSHPIFISLFVISPFFIRRYYYCRKYACRLINEYQELQQK